MRISGRHASAPVPYPTATLHSALAGDLQAVSSLLRAGWTLWISPAILQGKRGVVELRYQSEKGRERHNLPVSSFLALRDQGTITTHAPSPDDLWVRCSLSERTLKARAGDEPLQARSAVESSAA